MLFACINCVGCLRTGISEAIMYVCSGAPGNALSMEVQMLHSVRLCPENNLYYNLFVDAAKVRAINQLPTLTDGSEACL